MVEEFKKECCSNCRHKGLFGKCEKLNNLPRYKKLCCNKIDNSKNYLERSIEKRKIEQEHCCDDFVNMWLQYPIAVKDVSVSEIKYDSCLGHDIGDLVKIRLCSEDNKKTYVGILLGDLPTSINQSYNPEENTLKIRCSTNPAIYVPELKRIVFGYESWWGVINSIDELEEITDEDIENVWYVKLLKNIKEEN